MFSMFTRFGLSADERRIRREGQRDGEKNIPDMSSYSPSPFEQVLISHGERKAQRIYEIASLRIAKLQPVFQALKKRFEDLENRQNPVGQRFEDRKKELDRDVAIPFPSKYHLGLILFLAIGEFPLNTVVFRLFGEPEFLTYVMSSTLAVTIPLLGLFIGLHLRQSIPRVAGNILIGLLTPISVGASLFSISVLRTAYITSQAASGEVAMSNPEQMEYVLFSLNILVFFAALVSSFFAHDPDEKLDLIHSSLVFMDQKRRAVRKKLFRLGTKINGEIQKAKSQIGQLRSQTQEYVALYRQANMQFRQLLPPPTFRKNPEFPQMEWWSEVSVNGTNGSGG